jgi:hypothetical protein
MAQPTLTPHFFAHFWANFAWPWAHRNLIWQFARREVLGRYRGSVLGVGWAVLTPMAMLAVYTLVFRHIFKAKWPGVEDGNLSFALNLFAGLLVFNWAAEFLSRAPRLMTDQPNLVTKVVFPLHPRTAKNLVSFGLDSLARSIAGLVFTEPLDYFAFQKLVAKAGVVLTDSGGIQEESTYRQVPCLTLRPNTERPITVSVGSNELVPADMHVVREAIARIDAGHFKKGRIPTLWDGHATERVMETLEKVL